MVMTPKQRAYQQGRDAGAVIGQPSQFVFNPYDADREPELYEAWETGFDELADVYGEIAHLGI